MRTHALPDEVIHENVRDYYQRVLAGRSDLKTSACCSTGVATEHRAMLDLIHPEILDRSYGCGSPIPPLLDGCTVLDLGCGTGRDAYVAAALAGPRGRVIGVDMTESQIAVAVKHQDEQTRRLGLRRANVAFVHGFIEDLAACGIEPGSIDVVISNCVLNLSPDKPRAFGEIFRVLKPGGELYISDVFADRRVPDVLRADPVLLGECLAGAMYVEDFRRLLRAADCPDHRVVLRSPIRIEDADVHARIGMVGFESLTVRAFKLGSLEDACEDYGQVAVYQGTIPGHPHRFDLDDHHALFTGKPLPVCGNTASMLRETRYAPHFQVTGDRRTHHGLFPCGPPLAGEKAPGACC
jgi:SAM-dependent methyltransferase